MKDYYNILGLESGADDGAIRQAYKKLAMQHHPDRGGDAGRFQEIQEAYSILTDPERKAQWEQQKTAQQFNQGPFNFSFNFGQDLNDIFRDFHDPFGHFRNRAQKNRDLRAVIDLDLASTLTQQQRHLEIRNINGTTRTVQIDIPRGIQTGMQMRCAGHGDHSQPGLAPGDLILEFRVHVPSKYRIQGLDLINRVEINCIDAILGTTIKLHGLDNREFDVTIPSATQQGSLLRLAQQGLWDINQPHRGDLIVEVAINVPGHVTKDQLDRLKKLV